MSVQGLACIYVTSNHLSITSDVHSLFQSYLLHFFGFNFFKELPIFQLHKELPDLIIFSAFSTIRPTLLLQSLNELPLSHLRAAKVLNLFTTTKFIFIYFYLFYF